VSERLTIHVRPATPGDESAWAKLRRALWPEASEEEHRGDIAAYFGGGAREPGAVLLAERGHDIVGFVELSIRPYAEGCRTDRVGYLEGWYVVPEVRGTGVGRELVAASEQWARGQGCVEFASDAEADNEVSAAAHRALGFTDVGLIRCFWKSL
jgi:aminoglycoside 6'-N-acetyltransferase I